MCPGLRTDEPQNTRAEAGVIEQENSHTPPGGIKHAFEGKMKSEKSRLPDQCCLLESLLADKKTKQLKSIRKTEYK
jgi:hypothetical protein